MTKKESDPSGRRRFLGASLGARTAALAGWRPAPASGVGASDRIRIGVIGAGGRARGLMSQLKELPGQEMVAVSDVYEPRMLEAAEIVGGSPAKVLDYRRLLDDKDVHPGLIGAPHHWHKTMTPEGGGPRQGGLGGKPLAPPTAEGGGLVPPRRWPPGATTG